MRWIALVAGICLSISTLSGCTQQCFVTECDLDHYKDIMPANLDSDPNASQPPSSIMAHTPSSVVNLDDREPYYLTLNEAIARSLENGVTGSLSVNGFGTLSDDLISPNQYSNIETVSDATRVLAINPANSGAALEASQAKFDAKWVSAVGWNYVDQQVQGLGSFQNGEFASAETSLVKPLATGGVAGVTFSTNYANLASPPTFFPIQNPAYTARFDLNFEQPLWQNSGIDINQLLVRHPGTTVGGNFTPAAQSYLNGHIASINGGLGQGLQFGNQGILIARLRFDQSRAEYERIVNFKLANVEFAYWNLYSAYVTLYAAEQGLKQSYETWRVSKVALDVGGAGGGGGGQGNAAQNNIRAVEAQALGQYQEFRANRLNALGAVLNAERVLRGLMGMRAEDGKQLIPIDQPSVAPYYPDFKSALAEAIVKRPELVAAREELKARQLDLVVQKNYLKPDLRFRSRYGISGLGSRLDGDGSVFDAATGQFRSNNAFRNLSSTNFNDWNVGLVLNMPIGFRYENAAVRRAHLGLAQTWLALKNEEQKAERFLTLAYREIIQSYNEISLRRAQREAAEKELRVRKTLLDVGSAKPDPFLLEAQRRWANALSQEYQAISAYNNALAKFHFAKGTIAQHNNVAISEGPLPQCAQVRAVEHEKERSKALLVRERSRAVQHEPLIVEKGRFGLPALPVYEAPSVPALFEGADSDTLQNLGKNVNVPPGMQQMQPLDPGQPTALNNGTNPPAGLPLNTTPNAVPQAQNPFVSGGPSTPTMNFAGLPNQ